MARPRPALPPPPFWLNISKTRSRSRRGCPDLRRPRRSRPASRAPGADLAAADDAVGGGEPLGVLEHVGQDLADQDVIEVQQGQADRSVDPDMARCHDPAQRRQRLVDQFVESDRGGPQLERSRLDAGHVEQIGDQPGKPVRLQLDELQELGPVVRAQPGVDLAQSRHGGLDGGQRCPQVVRGRADEGAAPTVDLLEQTGSQSLFRSSTGRRRAPPGWRTSPAGCGRARPAARPGAPACRRGAD